jgi:hypothetical protein
LGSPRGKGDGGAAGEGLGDGGGAASGIRGSLGGVRGGIQVFADAESLGQGNRLFDSRSMHGETRYGVKDRLGPPRAPHRVGNDCQQRQFLELVFGRQRWLI